MMNDMLIRQFSLDINRNASDVLKMEKQIKRLKRSNVFLGLLAAGSLAYCIYLDQYIDKELNAIKYGNYEQEKET